jgi:hypothetical protein
MLRIICDVIIAPYATFWRGRLPAGKSSHVVYLAPRISSVEALALHTQGGPQAQGDIVSRTPSRGRGYSSEDLRWKVRMTKKRFCIEAQAV